MAFCTTLRRRASCTSLIPTLLSSSKLSFRENALRTHDLALPPRASTSQARKFRFLVLTASTIAPGHLDQTKSRIQHFASLTGGQDSAIIFLLYSTHKPSANNFTTAKELNEGTISGFHACVTLQYLLLTSALSIPLLLLSSPSTLPQVLSSFTTTATKSVKAPPIPVAVKGLLPYCTTNPPMDQTTLTIVSDLFPCLRDFAKVKLDEDLKAVAGVLASNWVDEETIQAVLEFWDEEVILQP